MLLTNSDFDDAPAAEGQPSGLAATQMLSQTPAAANLLAGTSSNPLDDLVSIFGGGGGAIQTPQTSVGLNSFSFGGSMGDFGSPSTGLVPTAPSQPQASSPAQQQSQQPQDDLLGLF